VTRDLEVAFLRDTVARLIVEANYSIPADILEALRMATAREESPLGRRTLEQLVRNYEVAAAERVPVCQDSGVAVVFLEIGQDVHWVGGSLHDAIQAGIRAGTKSGYLRRSVTGDPTRRLKMAWDPAGPDERLRPAQASGRKRTVRRRRRAHGYRSGCQRPTHGRREGFRGREHERDAHAGAGGWCAGHHRCRCRRR
jgi:tartrate dehydratase alpha subunit/fumarate hydratase class I-like protein